MNTPVTATLTGGVDYFLELTSGDTLAGLGNSQFTVSVAATPIPGAAGSMPAPLVKRNRRLLLCRNAGLESPAKRGSSDSSFAGDSNLVMFRSDGQGPTVDNRLDQSCSSGENRPEQNQRARNRRGGHRYREDEIARHRLTGGQL